MYNLFSRHFEGNFPVVKPPGFELVKRTYQRQIQEIQAYYRSRVFAVQSNHLLCRILMTSSVPVQYDISQFMEVVQARSPYVAKHFKLTSSIEYGTFHDGVFYGPGNQELIFSDEDYFSPFEAESNWQTLKPVRVLSHQISDAALLLPTGRIGSTASGFCAISINIPMLLMMYRGFLKQQMAKQASSSANSLLGVTHFVHMYVLPGMLDSHIDIVIMNRLNNLFRGNEMSRALKKHAFPVIDYTDRIDAALKDVLVYLTDRKVDYHGYLQNIPSIFHESMQESLIMPEFSRTRQAWWAMNLSRFEVMGLLLNIGGTNGIRSNGISINELRKACLYLNRENMLKSILPGDLYNSTTDFITQVLAL